MISLLIKSAEELTPGNVYYIEANTIRDFAQTLLYCRLSTIETYPKQGKTKRSLLYDFIDLIKDSRAWGFYDYSYGITWRAWDAKPTDEDRIKTKWGDCVDLRLRSER